MKQTCIPPSKVRTHCIHTYIQPHTQNTHMYTHAHVNTHTHTPVPRTVHRLEGEGLLLNLKREHVLCIANAASGRTSPTSCCCRYLGKPPPDNHGDSIPPGYSLMYKHPLTYDSPPITLTLPTPPICNTCPTHLPHLPHPPATSTPPT